jgi:hypothetical protein
LFSYKPRPNRVEWEQTINSLRPWLSPEKFKEAEQVHWRMFDRLNSWYEPAGSAPPPRRSGSR